MADVIKIVTTGLAGLVNRMRGQGSEFAYVGWGTGTTAPVVANTVLETPRAEARVLGTTSSQTTTTAGDTYRCVATLTCAGTGATISEIGMFDSNSGGNMFLRGTFSGIPLNVGDSIQFTIDTTLANV